MCKVTDDKKLRTSAVRQSGDAPIYYSTNAKQCKAYENVIGTLWDW